MYGRLLTLILALYSPTVLMLVRQALLERLPVNPTQRSIMCAFLRDELREILRTNRLSYHKSGSENKVSVQSNERGKAALLHPGCFSFARQ